MPDLIIILGPPASGKATIGLALAELTGFRFFHNHMTAEPCAALFGWATPEYSESLSTLRLSLLGRAAKLKTLPSIIFTFVWAFDVEPDTHFIKQLVNIFESSGEKVYFVELLASLEARVAREGSPLRMQLKPSKRNIEAARSLQRQYEGQYRLNSGGAFPYPEWHLVIDTEKQDAMSSARKICHRFGFLK